MKQTDREINRQTKTPVDMMPQSQTDRQADRQTDTNMMPQTVLLGGDGVGDLVAELCGDHHVVGGGDVLQQHPVVVVVLHKVPDVSTCPTHRECTSQQGP